MLSRFIKYSVIALSIGIIIPASINNVLLTAQNHQALPAEWQTLNITKDAFMWGAATSAFQIEGTQTANGKHTQNSWTRHGNKLPQPGIARDHWNRYKEDVQLIKQAGLTHYRFSIEWSKIEPENGKFDHDAMQHYIDLVDELIKHNITPVVCLFHHVWPVWFDDLGWFEKGKNIQYFVRFAQYVFKHLHDKVKCWMTFNEPTGYCFEGLVRGKYPPFKKAKSWNPFAIIKKFQHCGKTVYHMLEAHTQVYHIFKRKDHSAQIGFCHVMQPLYQYNEGKSSVENIICKNINYLLNDNALEFFKTGEFKWLGYCKKNLHAKHSLDWIGVNYYTRTVIKYAFPFEIGPANIPGTEIMGSNREFYPEGLRWAIRKTKEILPHTPIHITENGVNDPEDKFKDKFVLAHLKVMAEEIANGADIRGYFWWALMDTFSWKRGTDSRMGIYKVDNQTMKRTLCPSMHNFISFIKKQTAKY